MKTQTDADLVGRTRGGDREAYGELVARYQGHVYALAYSLVDNWAEAQDIAQETFIRAYVNLERLREPARFAGWLRRVTFSVAMEWIDHERLTPAGRLEAARELARLHIISLADLSEELGDLVTRSTPNRTSRVEVPGEHPPWETTLQHGDYYAANFAATGDAVSILDWDFLACGDPMWDLACLLKGDLLKEDREGVAIEAVTLAYGEVRPLDSARLTWQLDCFEAYWEKG